LNSGSAYSGSGRNLFDIPESALAFKLNRIFSGSATASISPDRGFEVNVFSTISGSFIVSSSARVVQESDIDTVFIVTNDGSGFYNISNALVSGSNPTLTLVRNVNYTFNVNAAGHPFWINETSGTGTGNSYDYWVTNNGEDVGSVTFLVSGSAPDTLYYNCQLHSSMAGTINVVDALYVAAEIKLIGETKVEGNLTASMYSGSGRGLFDIPQSAISGDTVRIASGSVTASVSPNFGFRVASFESGSDFSGSIRIDSSSFIYSEGTFLRNIPRSALTEDALISTEIKSGSITASVAPDYGFKVITPFTSSIDTEFFSTQIGSQFTGSVDISGSLFVNDMSGGLFIGSSSFIYGEGQYL
jgi:hypothetical protein